MHAVAGASCHTLQQATSLGLSDPAAVTVRPLARSFLCEDVHNIDIEIEVRPNPLTPN